MAQSCWLNHAPKLKTRRNTKVSNIRSLDVRLQLQFENPLPNSSAGQVTLSICEQGYYSSERGYKYWTTWVDDPCWTPLILFSLSWLKKKCYMYIVVKNVFLKSERGFISHWNRTKIKKIKNKRHHNKEKHFNYVDTQILDNHMPLQTQQTNQSARWMSEVLTSRGGGSVCNGWTYSDGSDLLRYVLSLFGPDFFDASGHWRSFGIFMLFIVFIWTL